MSVDFTKYPPPWAKDAIATKSGWMDKQTGEVLVAVSNLDLKKLNKKPVSKKPKAKVVKKSKKPAKFLVTHPDGKKEKISELKSFAEQHELQPTHLYKVISGKLKHHKNFKISKIGAKTKDK